MEYFLFMVDLDCKITWDTIYLHIQLQIAKYFLNSFKNNVLLMQILFYIWKVKENQGINT